MTPRQKVRKKWQHAELIKPGWFQNAPTDPLYYVSTKHIRQPNGGYGGKLIGKGASARAAWADAAGNLGERV